MSNLQLSLKRNWFEMTKHQIKPEDYREINPYWAKRLLLYQNEPLNKNLEEKHIIDMCNDLNKCEDSEDIEFQLDNWYLSFKEFVFNIMTLGYPKSTDSERILQLEHKGIEIRTGNPEWGAEPNKLYFVVLHGSFLK